MKDTGSFAVSGKADLMATNVFLAHTPYHVMLACGIAVDQGLDENHLLISTEFKDAGLASDAFQRWDRKPFRSVELLLGDYALHPIIQRRWRDKKNVWRIELFCRRIKPDRVFAFNDYYPYDQALLHFAKRNNPEALGIYVEEGANAYAIESLQPAKSWLIRSLYKIYFGSWMYFVRRVGSSRWIDEGWFIFPEHLRPDLPMPRTRTLPSRLYTDDRIGDWIRIYLEASGLDLESFKDIEGIVLVGHSDIIKRCPDYPSVMGQVLERIDRRCDRFAVKYHPRDRNPDYLGVGKMSRAVVLPQSWPAEFLFVLWPHRIRFVVADFSTSLMTSRWLLPNAASLSINPLLSHRVPSLMTLFLKIGVILIDNLGQLESRISGCRRSG